MNRLPEAEKYFRETAAVRESSAGIDSPELGETMNSLGLVYAAEGKFREAESAYKMSLSIREAALGLQSEPVKSTLENYAAMLQKANRPKDAARLTTLAQAIQLSAKPEAASAGHHSQRQSCVPFQMYRISTISSVKRYTTT